MNIGDAFEGSEIKALVQRPLMPLVALALEAEIPFPSGAAAVRRWTFLVHYAIPASRIPLSRC